MNKLNISKQVMSKIVTGAKSINVSEIFRLFCFGSVGGTANRCKTEPVTHHVSHL